MTRPGWLKQAAERSTGQSGLLGHVFDAYRQLHELSASELLHQLDCTAETLQWMSLCRTPVGTDLEEQVQSIARRFNVDSDRLLPVLLHVEARKTLTRRPSPLHEWTMALSDLDFGPSSLGFSHRAIIARFREELSSTRKNEALWEFIRSEFLPRISEAPDAAPGAGLFQIAPDELQAIHEDLLFSGQVTAVQGTAAIQDHPSASPFLVGIATVNFQGSSGIFSQRIFRKEFALQQSALNDASLLRLTLCGMKTYAERTVLVDCVDTDWRMGQGNPCAPELLAGGGNVDFLQVCLGPLQRLIREHQKFVFVSDALMHQELLTLGTALGAGEYFVFKTLEHEGHQLLDHWSRTDPRLPLARTFVNEFCPNVVMGLFKASRHAKPRLFYAHRDHVHSAVRVAVADSMLRPEKGWPLLLDIAEYTCRAVMGDEGFERLVQDAYAQAGAPTPPTRRTSSG